MATIGIDLGGSKIAVGVVDENGQILSRSERPTGAKRPWQAVVRDMGECAIDAAKKAGLAPSEIESVGVGVPGFFDKESGVVVFCTNLGWHDVPLREAMREYIDVPLYSDNDATVAGFAEAVAGVSKDASSSVFLTLGTGVGGGIVIGGKIWSGAHGVGSEIGHIMYQYGGIPCTCGARGCWERYASATALVRIGREAAARHPGGALSALLPERWNAKAVIDAARAGDPAAVEAFDAYTTHLANGIITIISFLDPELIVLGGGVSRAGAFLLEPVQKKVEAGKFFKTLPAGKVVLASLGNEAGLIGAAMLHRA
ncbi:MAG: ROK family glucokinase [Oscillospiraceae bacterium]|jgi:glucokinase|nr:ROK family glucokinase [Oscillospiraceae bacterium]